MWNQAPFATLLFLAGMQSIPQELHMAAEVDGAGYWQRFRYVTFPAIKPLLFLVLVLATVNGFLMLDLIYVLTMGGPGYDTTTISWLGFRTAFTFFKFGPGAAILYTLTVFCLFLRFQMKETLTWNYYVGFALVLAGVFFVFHFNKSSVLRRDENVVHAIAVPVEKNS